MGIRIIYILTLFYLFFTLCCIFYQKREYWNSFTCTNLYFCIIYYAAFHLSRDNNPLCINNTLERQWFQIMYYLLWIFYILLYSKNITWIVEELCCSTKKHNYLLIRIKYTCSHINTALNFSTVTDDKLIN